MRLKGIMKLTLAYGGLGLEPTHMEELLDIHDEDMALKMAMVFP